MTTEQRDQRIEQLEAAMRAMQAAYPYEMDKGRELSILDMVYRTVEEGDWDALEPASPERLTNVLGSLYTKDVDLYNKYEKFINDAIEGKVDRDCQFHADYQQKLATLNDNNSLRKEMITVVNTMGYEIKRLREGKEIRDI